MIRMHTLVTSAIETIDAATYQGYAREHPELIGAVLTAEMQQNALNNFRLTLDEIIKESAIIIADAIKNGLENAAQTIANAGLE